MAIDESRQQRRVAEVDDAGTGGSGVFDGGDAFAAHDDEGVGGRAGFHVEHMSRMDRDRNWFRSRSNRGKEQ